MIARDLQRARNTRIVEGGNEAGVPELRNQNGKSQSPLRSALKTSHGAGNPVRRDLSESFMRSNPQSDKIEQLQR